MARIAGKGRPAIPVKIQVSVAIRQSMHGGLTCPLCLKWLLPEETRVLEHLVPRATRIALGQEPDAPENLRWVHKECAGRKTNGVPATCADGDIHKIAKGKRLAAARAIHEAAKRGEYIRPPSRLKGKGFDKGLSKKFSGEVVRRG